MPAITQMAGIFMQSPGQGGRFIFFAEILDKFLAPAAPLKSYSILFREHFEEFSRKAAFFQQLIPKLQTFLMYASRRGLLQGKSALFSGC